MYYYGYRSLKYLCLFFEKKYNNPPPRTPLFFRFLANKQNCTIFSLLNIELCNYYVMSKACRSCCRI